jgi:cytochrome c-type biogenesis protein CcsB
MRKAVGIMVSAWVVSAAAGRAAAAAPPPAPDYAARLAFTAEAALSGYFDDVAVKTDRPMPWASFVAGRYGAWKGMGRKGGDLGGSADAAVWLALLDEDYRRNGRLIFERGGRVPAIPRDRWISLHELETEIMPTVIHTPEAFDDPKTAGEVEDLLRRAGTLHELSWDALLLEPGGNGEAWRPLRPGTAAAREAAALTAAYRARDARAARGAAAKLGRLLAAQGGYPPRARLTLELWLRRSRLFNVAFGLYVASALFFFGWAAFRKKALGVAGAAAAAAGWVAMTVGIVVRSVVAAYWPTTGMYEYVTLLAWAIVLFFLLFYVRTRQGFLGVIVMPVAFLLVVVASLFPQDIEGQLVPALQSWWLTIHVTLACLGEGAFAIAFAAALARIFRDDAKASRLPSRAGLAVIEYRAVALGYPLFAIGALVAGAIWAQKAWSVWWSWDPKETASLVVFLVATAYLHVRTLRGWRDAGADILAILIFVTAVLTLFANKIFGGLHSYGV